MQKYFFDPTFGGALINGQRNVFQTLDEVTPFAFADSPRRFSPIVSDLRIEPGKHFDTEFILNFDPKRNQLTAIGTLLKLKPYKQSFLTLAHFSTTNLATPTDENPPNFVFESRSNQVRALVGYGDLTRVGFNATAGLSYDLSLIHICSELYNAFNHANMSLVADSNALFIGPPTGCLLYTSRCV